MNTKEKIIKTAIKLFNQSDVKSVTTNHIAEQAGISPGNLYYHFRNKEEIISAIFDQMADEEVNACNNEEIATVQMLLDLFESLLNIYWKYRFFRMELPFLLNNDKSLKKRFNEYQDLQIADTTACVYRFIESGIIRKISDQQVSNLAENTALVMNFWIPFAQTKQNKITKQSLREGIQIIINLLDILRVNN